MVLHTPRKKGRTLYAQSEQVFRSTGVWPQEYPLPEVSDDQAYVWETFWDLINHGGPIDHGLTYQTILHWQEIWGVELSGEVIQLLFCMSNTLQSTRHTVVSE